MTDTEKLLNLIKENPDLPVVPMVNDEIVGDDSCSYWLGHWGRSAVTEYFIGKERIHFKNDDDEENVLCDLPGCGYSKTADGRDIYDLSDEEWTTLYNSLEWVKAIVVYIDL